jgi:acyl-CoA dehydrogenase
MIEGTQAAGSTFFELDDEHRDFQAVCRAFVDREVLPLVKEAEDERRFPAELWGAMGAAGLLGLGHPEPQGGTGGGHLAIALLSEQLARACGGIAVTPLVSAYMAAPHIARYGTPAQQERYLAGVLRGELVAAIAITEPQAGSDVAGIRTRATRTDGGYLLRGSKVFITNGGLADVIVVAALTDPERPHRGMTTFLVERPHEGLEIGAPMVKMGWHSSDTRELSFTDCLVPDDAVLGRIDGGFQQIMGALQTERISLAGMGLGLAQAALDDAVAYARDREAFGQPLGRHQVVRHRLAELTATLDAARLATYRAAARCDAGHPECDVAVAQAKLLSARAANVVADAAVQIFGGYGFIEETRVAMHYRDARILRIGGGTDEMQLEILAKRLAL